MNHTEEQRKYESQMLVYSPPSSQDLLPSSPCNSLYSSFDTDKELVIDESKSLSCVASPAGVDSGVASSIESNEFAQFHPHQISFEPGNPLPSFTNTQIAPQPSAPLVPNYMQHYGGHAYPFPNCVQQDDFSFGKAKLFSVIGKLIATHMFSYSITELSYSICAAKLS
jgi:hypothetical protein